MLDAERNQKKGKPFFVLEHGLNEIDLVEVYNLVVELKKITDIPLNLHTHFTSGMGDLAIFKAIEA